MGDSLQAAEIAGKPSYSDIRMMLRQAVFSDDAQEDGYVVEVAEGDAIIRRGGIHWRYPYTIENGMVKLGTPVEVKLSWQDAVRPVTAREPEAGTLAFATPLDGLQFSEGADTVRIEVCRDGKWKHARYGDIEVTPRMRESLIANFRANVREVGDLPLDYDHEAGPAPGWITGLVNEGNSLFADVKLTPSGRQKIRDGEYRFFSPEWHPDWENPRTGQKHGPTLFGGALTNKPFFRGMAAIQCSETTGAGGPGVEDMGAVQHTDTARQDAPGTSTGAQIGTQTGIETPGVTTQQFTELQQRLQAVEVENAALRAAEERRGLESTLAGLRFSEGRTILAPASRSALADALLAVPSEPRKKLLEAVHGLQFAELGERGFVRNAGDPETAEVSLTASEEADLRKMAESNGLKFEEVRATYAENKRKRLEAMGRIKG